MKWIVLVGEKSWTKCYGLFESDDACVVWLRANQFDVQDAQIYPVNRDEPDANEQEIPDEGYGHGV